MQFMKGMIVEMLDVWSEFQWKKWMIMNIAVCKDTNEQNISVYKDTNERNISVYKDTNVLDIAVFKGTNVLNISVIINQFYEEKKCHLTLLP